jgi:branched-chain amino acid aminotransferase
MEDFIAYFNGEYLPISKVLVSVNNLGFSRGYGAYECFRTYNREPFHFNDHIQRLKNTCQKLLIPFPNIDFLNVTYSLIEKNPDKDLIFRIFVTDSETQGNCELIILCNCREYFMKTHPDCAVKLKTVVDTRESIGIKSTTYCKAMVEIKKAKLEGFDDVLFVGEDNLLHEISRANIFAIKDQVLYTPKNNLLPGITRACVIEIAKDYGYKVKIEDIHLDFLKEAEEVFATATVRGITSVSQVNNLLFTETSQANSLQSYFKSLPYTNLKTFRQGERVPAKV